MTDLNRHDKYFQYSSPDELRMDLVGDKKAVSRKMAVMKRIIANASMGNDMSSLFSSVIDCLDIQELGMKKMVYLYLSNYGMAKKELLPMCIDKFVQDALSQDAMIRALALRTMSSLLTPEMVQALLDPVRRGLFDKNAYVRKTAAMCVAKMHKFDAPLMERSGFIEKLNAMMMDSHKEVLTSAVAALFDISERSTTIQLNLNFKQANNLAGRLLECSEWGQTYILEVLMFYIPQTAQEAHMLVDTISRHLQLRSPTLAMTATKVALYLLNYIHDPERKNALCRWISRILVQHMQEPPEILFTILKNVQLIVQRRPLILASELAHFFCTYNDPEYVKLVKLDIIYRLTTCENAAQVVDELQECASDISVDVSRKVINVLGRLALKWDSIADACMAALENILQNNVQYALQESIIVIKDILRKYPDRYGYIVSVLCEHIPQLDEPQAKVSMIWILGHYVHRIDRCEQLLGHYIPTFLDEPAEVQLALMTATVKLFLRKPKAGADPVQKVLRWATEQATNPDCRDRGFFYTRLLTLEADLASSVVFAETVPFEGAFDRMEDHLLDQLLLHGSSLVTVFHQQPSIWMPNVKPRYMPDSPALEEASRSHASTHMHRAPPQYYTMTDASALLSPQNDTLDVSRSPDGVINHDTEQQRLGAPATATTAHAPSSASGSMNATAAAASAAVVTQRPWTPPVAVGQLI